MCPCGWSGSKIQDNSALQCDEEGGIYEGKGKGSVLSMLQTSLSQKTVQWNEMKWNDGVLGHFFCTLKAELGRGQLGLMRWNFLWNLPQNSIEPTTFYTESSVLPLEHGGLRPRDSTDSTVNEMFFVTSEITTTVCILNKCVFFYSSNS